MQEELRPILAALATAGAVSNAHAVTLGDLQVESALGQRLEARVRVTPAAGETVDARCFSILGEVPQGLSAVPGLQVTLDPDGQTLRLTSRAPVQEPAAGLALRAACPGGAAESVREYVMLLDPLPPGASTVVRARRGETLESLARAMVERPGPRREYLVAMRAANPSLATIGDREALGEGTPVVLPDLRPAMRNAPAASTKAKPTAPAMPATSATPAKPTVSATPAQPAAERVARAPSPRPSRPPSEELKRATAAEAAAAPAQPSARAEMPAPTEAAKAPAPVAKAPSAPRSTTKPPATRVETKGAAPERSAPVAKRAAPARGDGFVLKLSSPEVDLSPSQQVNDAQRKQLRERLLVLDADDQVAALLALRHSVQQLESRVAELQLKLAKMPESFPARPSTPEPAPTPTKAASPASAPASTTPATPSAPTPSASTPSPVAAAPAAPVPEPSAPPPAPVAAPSTPPTAASREPASPPPAATPAAAPSEPNASTTSPAPSTPAPESQGKPFAKPVPAPVSTGAWWTLLPEWAWIAAAALVLLVLWLALRLRRPRPSALEETPADLRDAPAESAAEASSDVDLDLDAPSHAASARPAVDSDAGLATRLGDADSSNLRRRYIEERFPEVINGTIELADPDSVVKGARLFYEDGAMTRAVELLQFAIEDHPGQEKPWLALFEIFRLERLSGEYAELAQRFQKQHANSEAWRKVRWFGREIDPGNALYREEPVNTLETIGPREGKRLAANLAPVDPIAENWLQAPMDFENEVLANELRNALMARAQLVESDLVPNPMPALRNVEMFTVA